MRTQPIYPDEIIGEVVTATSGAIVSKNPNRTLLETIQANEIDTFGSTQIQQIRYSKSSFDELIETLLQLDGSGEERFNKYPLVHLVQDVTYERGGDIGLWGNGLLNVIFIHQSQQTYKIEDRDAKVFKPVLWPMYYEFLYQLSKSGWIFGSDTETGEFRHRVIKRGYWGNRQLHASKNILNDYVDAIEIQNMPVKFNLTYCP